MNLPIVKYRLRGLEIDQGFWAKNICFHVTVAHLLLLQDHLHNYSSDAEILGNRHQLSPLLHSPSKCAYVVLLATGRNSLRDCLGTISVFIPRSPSLLSGNHVPGSPFDGYDMALMFYVQDSAASSPLRSGGYTSRCRLHMVLDTLFSAASISTVMDTEILRSK